MISGEGYVKAICEYDAMGIAFEIERPEAAIADPGRIRIRQVSPQLMRTSQFFEKFLYKIHYRPEIINYVLGEWCKNRRVKTYEVFEHRLFYDYSKDSSIFIGTYCRCCNPKRFIPRQNITHPNVEEAKVLKYEKV